MTSPNDIVVVGGGLAGATLAKVMAERGCRVVVLEREHRFKDRVRGEWIAPWGVAEARLLGVEQLLRDTCAHELPAWDVLFGTMPVGRRDLVATTPQRLPAFGLYHPIMQEVLLQAAADAGAEVRRGVTVRDVTPGPTPTVLVEERDGVTELKARLVAGADGRASLTRQWAGFDFRRDPDGVLIAGMLLENVSAPTEASHIVFNPALGQASYLFPQRDARVRAYVVYAPNAVRRLQGVGDVGRFISQATQVGVAESFCAGARAAGPLASFETADAWVPHPYRGGVVLLGDAAATSDPTYGQGLSLTLRDVRVLRDHLLASTDWDAAAHAYADAHDRHYDVIHRVDRWFSAIVFERGAAADARRMRALPLLAAEPGRLPDHGLGGPDLPIDDSTRRRFFGEE